MSKLVDQNQVVQNPLHDVSHEEITLDTVDPSDVANITDNTIRNAGEISDAMQFSSKNAASAFADISGILNGGGTNEEKKAQIAEKSKDVQDTTLQVFANMAIGMLGSSKEGVVDEKEAPGIEKLSKAFAFLGHQINDEDDLEKDKRSADMIGAYASLMTDTEIDEDTKKSIKTAFEETPDIAKIAQIQEGVENKDPKELEEVEKTIHTDDLKDPSTYDGKNWEDFKSKAIYGAKGAIAIGLLFAPGGIFLAPIFLLATKNFGRNPDDIEKEQKDAEAAELESEKALELLNAFKKYLSDPEKVKQNEVELREQNEEKDDPGLDEKIANKDEEKDGDKIVREEGGELELDNKKALEAEAVEAEAEAAAKGLEQNEVDEQGEKSGLVNKNPTDEATIVGEKAEEFVEKENDSLTRTQGTLGVNKEGLKRVKEVEVKNTAASVVDEATKAALANIIGGLGGTKMEEKHKDETTDHGVTKPQVGGGAITK